jgi:hypothetical protein
MHEMRFSESSDNTSDKDLRKPFRIDKKHDPVSLDRYQNAMRDAETKSLTSRDLKDKVNVISSWIGDHIDELSEKEKATHERLRKAVSDTFDGYQWAVRLRNTAAEKEQNFRDTTQEYLQFVRMLEDPIERFYFAKDIHPLTLQEIQKKNDYFDEHYIVKCEAPSWKEPKDWELTKDWKSPEDTKIRYDVDYYKTIYWRSRINVEIYDKESECPYENVISLKDGNIEAWNNNKNRDANATDQTHLSDIKYQALRKALEWARDADDPFTKYKDLSIDNFQPRRLSGHMIVHREIQQTVFQTIEGYKQKAGQSLTQEENDGTFFFPSGGNEFHQIMLNTLAGKEKLFFLRNYFPDLRCTGVTLRVTLGKKPQVDEMEYHLEKK